MHVEFMIIALHGDQKNSVVRAKMQLYYLFLGSQAVNEKQKG